MRLGIMQPYFLPYLGYWQLVAAVDRYVIYDDVAFRPRTWMTRNTILAAGEPLRITLNTSGGTQNRLINEVNVGGNTGPLLKTITQAYAKASWYDETMPLVERILGCPERNLAAFLAHGVRAVCAHLGLRTELVMSSALPQDRKLRGQARILDICERMGAKTYVNSAGGAALYETAAFAARGIALRFLHTLPQPYPQRSARFVPDLSIVDVLMSVGARQAAAALSACTLEPARAPILAGGVA